MTVADDYLAIARELDEALTLPRIARVWLPPLRDDPAKSAEFGAVILEDDSVGLMFVLLEDTLQQINDRLHPEALSGTDVAELAQEFASSDPARKALGLGAINAIGQHVIRTSGLRVDTATGSIAAFDPQPGDRIGMVGYFPPLVEQLRNSDVALTVVELKPELVQREERFEVTLDPGALRRCNKILGTSTMLLNDSVESMLAHFRYAEQVAIIGPSAGFLPDPLFARGVDTVGGNRVLDVAGFIARCERGEPWGPTTRKYCLHRRDYPGYRALVERMC